VTPSPTLVELEERFLVAKQVEGKTEKTVAFYRQNLDRIAWWLQHNVNITGIEQITPDGLRSFLAYVRTATDRWGTGSSSSRKPASMATVDAYWRTLQAFFSWLVRQGYLPAGDDPVKKIPRPRVPEKIVEDIPLPLIRRALEGCGRNEFNLARNRAIILTLLDAGIRLSACHGLGLADVDLETGLARVWEKGRRQCLVHLAEAARQAVREYLEKRRGFAGRALWVREDGVPLSKTGIQSMVRRLRRFGGNARWTPHTFRNTFAVNLLRNGADTFSLQTLGGWKNLEMPRHYTLALRLEDAVRVHARTSPADRLLVRPDQPQPAAIE